MVWTSSVDKHTVEGEIPIRLCNYTDAYKKDRVHAGDDLMRATATAEEIKRNRLKVGDSVFTKDSEDPTDIGISAFVDGESDDFVCGYHLAIARPADDVHPRFLNWALRSRPVLDHFGNSATGISRYGISIADLRATPVPTPSDYGAQQQIADFLDDSVSRIDRIIAARREQLELAHLAFDSWWEKETVELASRGRVIPLRRVLDSIVDGPFGSSLTSQQYTDFGTRVVRLGNIGIADFRDDDRAYIADEYADVLSGHAVRAGDLVMAGLGDERWPLGRCAVMPDIGPGIVKADCYRIRLRHGISHAYAAIALSSPFARNRIGLLARGATRARLNTDVAREAPLVLVPPPDQESYVALWRRHRDDSARNTRALEQSVDLLAEYKSSLITAAVTGELDVTTASSNIPG